MNACYEHMVLWIMISDIFFQTNAAVEGMDN